MGLVEFNRMAAEVHILPRPHSALLINPPELRRTRLSRLTALALGHLDVYRMYGALSIDDRRSISPTVRETFKLTVADAKMYFQDLTDELEIMPNITGHSVHKHIDNLTKEGKLTTEQANELSQMFTFVASRSSKFKTIGAIRQGDLTEMADIFGVDSRRAALLKYITEREEEA